MPYNLLMPKEEQRSRPPWWFPVWHRRWWIALAMLFVLVWWLVPPWLYRHTGTTKDAKLRAITDTRTALLAGLIGVGALLTFWLNSRVYRITARTLEVTEQGHITERYTKAIEQLGSDKLDVRLGGIYALERIAVDSERDHPTVVEVLSAFVREHSHLTHSAAPEPTIARVRQPGSDRSGDNAPKEPALSRKPTTDVQAAITVLGRLPQRSGVSRGDLSGALLAGAQLDGANLAEAKLDGANLAGAQLEAADLTEAKLGETNLAGANLGGANLAYAYLNRADLPGADLFEANLLYTNLGEANLSGATLTGANLSGATPIGADLSGAELSGANLSGTPLLGADLSGARLDGLIRHIHYGSNTPFGPVIGLTQEQLNVTSGDARTRLPDGLRRPDAWTTGDEPSPVSS
jgi:hypothetical protein